MRKAGEVGKILYLEKEKGIMHTLQEEDNVGLALKYVTCVWDPTPFYFIVSTFLSFATFEN